MTMTTTVALENMKYHKSKNILTGIAILLTTFLLLVIRTAGYGIIEAQNAAAYKTYPTWHILFRSVDRDAVDKLAAHHAIEVWGLRSDAGMMCLEDADVSMISGGEKGA